MFVYINANLFFEHGNVTNKEFMKEVARHECVYNRNSKNFKDKNKKANSWEKIGEKFNLSCLFMNIFRSSRTKKRNEFGCSKISSSMSAVTAFCVPPCYLFPRTLGTSAVCSPIPSL